MPFKPVDQAIKVILGPCIDDTDFKAREESLTYDQAGMEIDVILEKHDGTVTTTAVTPTTSGLHDWAHTDQGYYELEIPASGGDYANDTEGTLTVVGYCTGVLPFRSASYDIVPEKVWNSLVEGSDNLEVDAVAISGDSTAADNLELATENAAAGYVASDLTHIHGSALTETAGQLAARFKDFFDQASASFNVSTALASFMANVAALAIEANVQGHVDTALASINLDHLLKTAVADKTNLGGDGGSEVVEDTVMALLLSSDGDSDGYDYTTDSLEAIRDRGDSAWTTASCLDAAGIRVAVGLASANLDTQLSALSGYVDCLPASWVTVPTTAQIRTELETNGGKLDHLWEMTEDDGGTRRLTENALEEAPTGGSAPTVEEIRAEIDSNSTQLTAILADTNELQGNQADWATATGFLDAAGVRAAIGLASANLDTQLSALSGYVDCLPATLDGSTFTSLPTVTTDATSRTASKADVSALATAAALATVHDNMVLVLADTGTDGVVVAAPSKTGYKLASDGLDNISDTGPTGVASNFREMIVQLWRRFFGKATMTEDTLTTTRDDGNTAATTQALSDDGTTQTQGEAS